MEAMWLEKDARLVNHHDCLNWRGYCGERLVEGLMLQATTQLNGAPYGHSMHFVYLMALPPRPGEPQSQRCVLMHVMSS